MNAKACGAGSAGPAPQTNMRIFHGFRADPIIISPALPGDTVEMGGEVNLLANPYPYLLEQDRINYQWAWAPSGELEGAGNFQFTLPNKYKSNKFSPDYPGDVELSYQISDLVSGIYADSPEPNKVVHIRPVITITTPAPGSKFVYSTATPGVLTINATATVNPQSLNDDIEWSIWNIDGSNLTTNPSPPRGNSVTFTYTNLPDKNDQFGEKYVIASIPAYGEAESAMVKVYFSKNSQNNPVGLEPNWFFYWKQTVASIGKQVYDPDTSKVGYYIFGRDYFFVGFKAALSDTVICAHARFYGIDYYAAVCRHENRHMSDYDDWWRPIGGYTPNLHLDFDVDRCLDSVEPTLVPALDPTKKITYPKIYPPNIKNFDDFEYRGYEQECDWIQGSADSLDWACPGHQY